MKEIKLHARLSAYSKVEAVECTSSIEEVTRCDIDQMFGDPCDLNCEHIVTESNEMSCSDIDQLFS